MEIQNQVVVVTGGAHGIGRALCERFAQEGAAGVVVADVDFPAAEQVAQQINGLAVFCNVGVRADIDRLVDDSIRRYGRIDLFCSNAGITTKGGLEVADCDWQRMWEVNVLSRLYAAQAVVPAMLEQGGGYLLHTASAAGLLTEIGSAAYSVTKHADLALAEWLSVQYGRDGIGVSCMCPLGVETAMLDPEDPIHQFLQIQSVTVEDVADSVIAGLADEQFLILPHPQVAEFFGLKAEDHDRWLRGMQRLNQKLTRRKQKRAA